MTACLKRKEDIGRERCDHYQNVTIMMILMAANLRTGLSGFNKSFNPL
jgi:hypothetical protein